MKTKISQSAIEFVVLSTFMFLVILGFFAITASKMFEARDEIDTRTAQEISDFAYKEIEIATSVSDGYTRYFSIPRTVDGQDYNISLVDGRELIVNFNDKEYLRFMPANVTGNITKGLNLIKRINNVVYIQPVLPQCENGVDDDLDINIDTNDPGCYAGCNYLNGGAYRRDWSEADSCDCTFVGSCCLGIGTGSHYSLFDGGGCGAGQCWSFCLGPTIFAVIGTNNMLFFQSTGDALLRGALLENQLPFPVETANDELIIMKNNNNMAIIDLVTGDMKIRGVVHPNQAVLNPTDPSDDFIITDNTGSILGYIDDSGDFWIMGTLTQNLGAALG